MTWRLSGLLPIIKYLFVKANLFRNLKAPLPVRQTFVLFISVLIFFLIRIQCFISRPQRNIIYHIKKQEKILQIKKNKKKG